MICLKKSYIIFLGKPYFEALKKFGISKIIESYKDSNDKLLDFLKFHLVGGSREMDKELVQELCQFFREVNLKLIPCQGLT